MEEYFFQCSYCWEEVSILLDTSITNQTYVEDCEVCCNPLEFNVCFKNGELVNFSVNLVQ
ncbi:CPXCG motif-containing cysteine-rich protein [Lutibacter citreus]|uniref:CPXCG motif-containing cysteine-rich protein n=1 Tax=Lutibacter citreus TaxID=2138210 RepID=UPI000DBE4DC0|nr:CPXCG motif-containing cysteine-rich protein [Lutibacter citreus]